MSIKIYKDGLERAIDAATPWELFKLGITAICLSFVRIFRIERYR